MIVKSLRAFVCSSTCDHEARHCGQQQARVGLYLDVTIASQTRGCSLETLELERESSLSLQTRWEMGYYYEQMVHRRTLHFPH